VTVSDTDGGVAEPKEEQHLTESTLQAFGLHEDTAASKKKTFVTHAMRNRPTSFSTTKKRSNVRTVSPGSAQQVLGDDDEDEEEPEVVTRAQDLPSDPALRRRQSVEALSPPSAQNDEMFQQFSKFVQQQQQQQQQAQLPVVHRRSASNTSSIKPPLVGGTAAGSFVTVVDTLDSTGRHSIAGPVTGARIEEAREVTAIFRQFNAQQRHDIDSLQRRVEHERAGLEADTIMARRAVSKSPSRSRVLSPKSVSSIQRVPMPVQQKASPEKKKKPANRPQYAPNAQQRRLVSATKNKVEPVPIDAASFAVAQAFGVVLPSPLPADGELPSPLFFATGVQLTRQQREALALAMKGGAAPSQDESFGRVLGTRAPQAERSSLHHRDRVQKADEFDRKSNVQAWEPFRPPAAYVSPSMARSSRRAVTKAVPRPKTRTAVLRDVFQVIDPDHRGVVQKHEVEDIMEALVNADYATEGELPQHTLTRSFLTEFVLPLLLGSGFLEWEFPTFSQIVLRAAQGKLLPHEHESLLAFGSLSMDRRGVARSNVDPQTTDQLMDSANWYLNELATPAAAMEPVAH
jgi:hypothetical protein